MRAVRDACLELLLGVSCQGCGWPGRVLCAGCRSRLPIAPWPAWPTPTPPGLVEPWAVADYDGLVRSLVLGHKERGLLGLARPLGELLARSVLATGTGPDPLVLVPVPTRASNLRARGHDPTWSMVRAAAGWLGPDVIGVRLLRSRSGVRDQAGLGAAERGANLDRSMACSSSGLRRLANGRPRARIVLCDDVLTTGATLREAQRALEDVGVQVDAAAVVAATRRRTDPRSALP